MKTQMLISAIILTFLVGACAPTANAPCPTNLEPMYGGQPKSLRCQMMDQQFIAAIDEKGESREVSSVKMAQIGYDYLNKGDINTAMKRFNQAWLIDPDNCLAFGGFGLVKHLRDHDVDTAMDMYDMALQRCPDNGEIMSDYGRVLEENGIHTAAVSMFEKSLRFFPDNLEAYKGLIRSHIQLGNDEATLGAIQRGQKYGLGVDRRLIEELERRIKEAR